MVVEGFQLLGGDRLIEFHFLLKFSQDKSVSRCGYAYGKLFRVSI